MRQTTLKPPMRKGQNRTHIVQTKAPPVGGMDTINPRALMPEQNAIVLDNFISAEAGVTMREGWYEYATHVGGASSPIRSIFSFEAAPANSMVSPLSMSELFATNDAGIFLIEGGGDLTTEPAEIALSGNPNAGRFSFVEFTTQGQNYLVACSETDGGFLFNGITWMKMTSTGGPGPGFITGVDPTKFVHVCAYKKRLMFVERASTKAWILDVGQVGGVAKLFDFGPLMRHGGVVLMLVNWTQDAGEGTDDRLMVIGSAGDLAVYQGNDPTDATQFSNVGIWYIGQPPIGRRNVTSGGGNPYALTAYGLISLGRIIDGGLDNILTSDADMLRQLRLLQEQLAEDFKTKLYTDGWEIVYMPSKSLLLVTRPRVSVSDDYHYVFQFHNLAWSRLLEMPGVTFGVRLNEVYTGTEDGRVLRVFDGHTDGKKLDGSGAVHIRGQVVPAFNYFGAPDTIKQALMVRPTFLSAGQVSYSIRMNVDFDVGSEVITPIEQDLVGALWDQARWDQSKWAPAFQTSSEWRAVEGIGYALAPSIFVSSQTRCVLASIAYMLKPGGPL